MRLLKTMAAALLLFACARTLTIDSSDSHASVKSALNVEVSIQ